jgi:hypothetical protein
MYCSNCGGPVQPGQNFCNRCGQSTAIGAPPGPQASAPMTAASAPPPVSASPTGGPPPAVSGPAPAVGPAAYGRVSQPSRLARHIQILGILWIVVSVFRLIPAVGILFFGHMGFPFLAIPMRGFLLPILGGIGAYLAVTAVAGIAAGWGLIDRQPWARMFAVVIGCLKLIDFPFGTALGVYTLWVLASQGAEDDYRRMARAN